MTLSAATLGTSPCVLVVPFCNLPCRRKSLRSRKPLDPQIRIEMGFLPVLLRFMVCSRGSFPWALNLLPQGPLCA